MHIKSIIEKVQYHAGKNGKVLDVGSGVGNKMKALLDVGYDVHGFEPSGTFYKYFVAKTYMPKILDGLFTWLMSKTKTGIQLVVVLEKL